MAVGDQCLDHMPMDIYLDGGETADSESLTNGGSCDLRSPLVNWNIRVNCPGNLTDIKINL